MASNNGFGAHGSYNHDEIDVSDVVNLAGLNDEVEKQNEIKHSGTKRKHRFMDEDEMDFQTWTNGFLHESMATANEDEIVVEYYNDGGASGAPSDNTQEHSNQTPSVNDNGTNTNAAPNTHHTSKKQRDDFMLKCMTYDRAAAGANGNDEDLAVQAVSQAVSQAVQAVQEANGSQAEDPVTVDYAAAVAAVEAGVLDGLKATDKESAKRSDRQLFELIQSAINSEKLVKNVQTSDKLKSHKDGKPPRKMARQVKSEISADVETKESAKLASGSPLFTGDSNERRLEEAILLANGQIPLIMTQSPSRSFAREEKVAIDTFVTKYQEIENISKEEFLERIWSNERKRDKFWDILQRVLPYRTRPSLYKHVRRTYHVFQKRGVWTPEEDEQLRLLQAEFDVKWKIIGEHMKRMPEDCRDRWRNYLKCGQERNTNKWSAEEEKLLESIVNNIEGTVNWTKVSELMNGKRSRIQCRYKWNKIVKRASKGS